VVGFQGLFHLKDLKEQLTEHYTGDPERAEDEPLLISWQLHEWAVLLSFCLIIKLQ
jgi:hypothetical protein